MIPLLHRYTLYSILSLGKNNILYTAYDKQKGCVSVVKVFFCKNRISPEQLLTHIKAIRTVTPTQYATIYMLYASHNKVFLAMEYITFPSLQQFIDTHALLPWYQIKPLILQLLHTLNSLHQHHYFHAQINSNTLFINNEDTLIFTGIQYLLYPYASPSTILLQQHQDTLNALNIIYQLLTKNTDLATYSDAHIKHLPLSHQKALQQLFSVPLKSSYPTIQSVIKQLDIIDTPKPSTSSPTALPLSEEKNTLGITVTKHKQGDYHSLYQALYAAPPFATIYIDPDTYLEEKPLIINKPVIICSTDPKQSVIIQILHRQGMILTAPEILLHNITFKQQKSLLRTHFIYLQSGQVRFIHCHIYSKSKNALLCAKKTHLHLEHCHLQASLHAIKAKPYSHIKMLDSTLLGLQDNAIDADHNAELDINNCRIKDAIYHTQHLSSKHPSSHFSFVQQIAYIFSGMLQSSLLIIVLLALLYYFHIPTSYLVFTSSFAALSGFWLAHIKGAFFITPIGAAIAYSGFTHLFASNSYYWISSVIPISLPGLFSIDFYIHFYNALIIAFIVWTLRSLQQLLQTEIS